MKIQEFLTHEVETAKIQALNELPSNLVVSEIGKFGMKVVCHDCFNPNIHRATGSYSKKGCQILVELKSI